VQIDGLMDVGIELEMINEDSCDQVTSRSWLSSVHQSSRSASNSSFLLVRYGNSRQSH
jgi:hypothetical protein